MSMRFLFTPHDKIDRKQLLQGDIISKTEKVATAISQAHAYYAEAKDYTHFIVLTQSCDLVRRRGQMRAPYITIAAVRPMSVAVEKFFEKEATQLQITEVEIAKLSTKKRLEMFLERLIHNTESDLFFIPKDGDQSFEEDLCAYLHLSIALRPCHYETLLSSKLAQLSDVFRAKLGWLKGNIYSRVATPDVEEYLSDHETYKRAFYERYTPREKYLWLSSLQLDVFRERVRQFSRAHGVDRLDAEQTKSIADQIPTDIEILSNYITEQLIRNGILDKNNEEMIRKTRNSIKNTPALKQVVSRIS